MEELRTATPDPAVPRPAEDLDFMGEYESGSYKAKYLVRRADGQVVTLTHLLYLVVAAIDGRRDFGQIAEEVSQEFGRQVSADNIQFLVENKLRQLGVLGADDSDDIKHVRLDAPLLGLKLRLGVFSGDFMQFITTPFHHLFRAPIVVTVLLALLALDVWLVTQHGILQGLTELLYQRSCFLHSSP